MPSAQAHAAAPADAPRQRPSLGAALALAAGDIKISHSVFALPFAVLGAFMAFDRGAGWGRFGGQLALVVACMVLARTWAMLVNRLADARFDAANPRTAGRAVASGRLPAGAAAVFAGACAAGFVAACWLFLLCFANPWPVALALPVLGWLALYSFAKRFTALCHVLLGSALAISPLAAALAVRPHALADTPALLALSAMVLLWVAGFDIVYALQDEAFDRAQGLRSIPARLGARGAATLSRVLHAGAALALLAAWRLEPRFGTLFLAGAVLASALLAVEHAVLERRGLAGLPLAFFTLNGVVSCLVGAAGVTDLLA
ncbi:MAG: UbiA family prenyltransferase [Phycisphaerae bacterium]|nr:UbiA family prenyltransferase [Phycisphaerae bacterium]